MKLLAGNGRSVTLTLIDVSAASAIIWSLGVGDCVCQLAALNGTLTVCNAGYSDCMVETSNGIDSPRMLQMQTDAQRSNTRVVASHAMAQSWTWIYFSRPNPIQSINIWY